MITEGGKTICTITKPSGTCSPGSNTLLKTGTYELVATYTGNYSSSESSQAKLTVKK